MHFRLCYFAYACHVIKVNDLRNAWALIISPLVTLLLFHRLVIWHKQCSSWVHYLNGLQYPKAKDTLTIQRQKGSYCHQWDVHGEYQYDLKVTIKNVNVLSFTTVYLTTTYFWNWQLYCITFSTAELARYFIERTFRTPLAFVGRKKSERKNFLWLFCHWMYPICMISKWTTRTLCLVHCIQYNCQDCKSRGVWWSHTLSCFPVTDFKTHLCTNPQLHFQSVLKICTQNAFALLSLCWHPICQNFVQILPLPPPNSSQTATLWELMHQRPLTKVLSVCVSPLPILGRLPTRSSGDRPIRGSSAACGLPFCRGMTSW